MEEVANRGREEEEEECKWDKAGGPEEKRERCPRGGRREGLRAAAEALGRRGRVWFVWRSRCLGRLQVQLQVQVQVTARAPKFATLESLDTSLERRRGAFPSYYLLLQHSSQSGGLPLQVPAKERPRGCY